MTGIVSSPENVRGMQHRDSDRLNNVQSAKVVSQMMSKMFRSKNSLGCQSAIVSKEKFVTPIASVF
jgi:hypothetical protein